MRVSVWLMVAILALPVIFARDAEARSLGRMLRDSGLAPSDISTMEAAARQLFEPMGRTGDARRWSNPKSRSKGAVTLGRIEGGCAELVHRVRTLSRPETATYRTWRCRMADGTWQISPGPN